MGWAQGLNAALSGVAPVLLCAGNEASDADSIVSALLYAYWKREEALATGAVSIPLVACAREDVCLRRETVLLLELCGVNARDLVFQSDAGASALLQRTRQLVLVDHNSATGPLVALGERVVEIVDHHQDLGSHDQVTGVARSIAFQGGSALVGSCCTLIAEAFLATEVGRGMLSLDEGAAARALLGVVLIDTVNLNPDAKKATDRDIAVVRALGSYAPLPPRAELFARLDDAKFDEAFWNTLTVAQCMRYDYKAFKASRCTVGLASVLCSFSDLAAKEGFIEELTRRSSEVTIYGVMSSTRGGSGMRRELALVSTSADVTSQAVEFLRAWNSPHLELEHVDQPTGAASTLGLRVFKQGNVAASRKQVAPALIAFLNQEAPF